MALVLPEYNAVIYEIPKTGTTWVREALGAVGVAVTSPKSTLAVCNRHSPWWAYKSGCAKQYAIIRHPMHWYESYWCYSEGRRDAGMDEGNWHIRKTLHFDTMHVYSDYVKWVDYVLLNHPAVYTRMVESFFGPSGYNMLAGVLYQEDLAASLALLLSEIGHKQTAVNLYRQLVAVPSVNTSNRSQITIEQRRATEARICAMEIEVIRRFYCGPEYAGKQRQWARLHADAQSATN